MAPQRSHRRPLALTNDKTLLQIFLAAALLVAISIVLVPLNIENESVHTHHGVDKLTLPARDLTRVRQEVEQPKEKPSVDVAKRQQPPLPNTPKAQDPPPKHQLHEQPDQQPHQLEKHAEDTDDDKPIPPQVPYHVVFSTGCSIFQDWQSYVFFYHAVHSGQEGHITRIASGCSEKDAAELKSVFAKEIEIMAPGRLHLQLTPEFARVKKGLNFKYFNKPFGTRYWMQHALGYPDKHLIHDSSIVILLDPDQIMIRPFTNDFTNSSEKWRLKEGFKLKVEHGSPFAQQYGFGLQWLNKVNPKHVFRGPSPVANMTRQEAYNYYMAMGPPYVATAKDMWSIVDVWAEIVPRVHDDYPHLLAEMFGFNLAAAHQGLRHTVAHSFMVSDVYAGGEGWKLIDAIPAEDVCHNFPKSEYPHVIHYCQRYFLGKWFIGKYRLRKDFISCEAPLLKVPPADIVRYRSAYTPDGKDRPLKPHEVKEEAFMVCAMIRALNDAATYFKDHHCDKETANYEYTYVFHKNMNMPEDEI